MLLSLVRLQTTLQKPLVVSSCPCPEGTWPGLAPTKKYLKRAVLVKEEIFPV
jgi:hypothetical protein